MKNELIKIINKKKLIPDFDPEKIKVFKSKFDMYDEIAETMANKLSANNRRNKKTVFILPVGPRGQYTRFAKICNEKNISCRNLLTINMDEFLDENECFIPVSSPFSFKGFMEKNLFGLLKEELKMDPGNILFPEPGSLMKLYELLLNFNGADICFAGVGINGHVAFNEPAPNLDITLQEFKKLKTRILTINRETKIMTSLKHGGYIEKVPDKCITIGMHEILLSKEINIYFEHTHQAAMFEKVLYSRPMPEIPVTVLKEHNNINLAITYEVLESFARNSFI